MIVYEHARMYDLSFDLPGEMHCRKIRNEANAIQYMTTWPMKCTYVASLTNASNSLQHLDQGSLAC